MWVALDSGGGFRLVPSSWSIDWNNQCLHWKVNIIIIFGIRNSVHVLPEAFQIQCFVVLFPQTMCGCVEARRLVVIGGVWRWTVPYKYSILGLEQSGCLVRGPPAVPGATDWKLIDRMSPGVFCHPARLLVDIGLNLQCQSPMISQ